MKFVVITLYFDESHKTTLKQQMTDSDNTENLG